MAIELSRLVVESDTSDLKKGQADLHAFGSEAQKTSGKLSPLAKVLGVFSKTSKAAAGSIQSTNLAYAEGDIELNKSTNSLLKNTAACKNNKRAYEEEAQAVQKLAAGQQKLQKTLAAAVGGDTRGAAQANRFNSSNMLAQFQDIAVTSAMGMNPMLIAMQQGTQLQYILANSNAPLKDFVAGLKSAFSMAGLLAIGLTGLVAALIQMVNWTKVGEVVLKGLGSGFSWLGQKLNFSTLERLGNYFKDLANRIGAAHKALEGWNQYLVQFDLRIENEEFERSIEDLDVYTKEYERAKRELGLEFSKRKAELMARGESDEEISKFEKGIYLIEERAKKAALSKLADENREKEKKALEESAKAIEKNAQNIERLAEAWDNLNLSAQGKINDLIMKKQLIGAGTYETVYTQTLADLTRQAEGDGIDLYAVSEDGKTKYEELEEYAKSTANLSVEVEKLTERYDLAKSSVKSLFSEMRQGLKEGESLWESFGNAALNVLDKIIDKTMDLAVDIMFMAGRSYFGGNSDIGQGVFNAMGGQVGVKPVMAANGGVFSNGVYSSPTVFQFAKGGKFGVMGEAGPEAVMPLTRGPDGSLGVRADNAGNSSPVVVNIINNSNAQANVEQRQTTQGVELDVVIDQLVAEKMNKPGTSSNSALRAFSNQKLIMR